MSSNLNNVSPTLGIIQQPIRVLSSSNFASQCTERVNGVKEQQPTPPLSLSLQRHQRVHDSRLLPTFLALNVSQAVLISFSLPCRKTD